jgi:VCBS repeat-containing protein
VAYSTAITVKIGATYTGTLRVTDADWDELSFTYLTSPRHGMLTMRDFAGGFSYTPTTTRATTDSFSFRVNDGCENSAIATVRISIVK